MVRNSAIAPTLRLPGFKKEWRKKRLGDYLSFKNGVNTDKSSYGSGCKFVNVLDVMSESPLTYDSIIGSVSIPEGDLKKNEVNYGDILFQRSSETREDVGVSNVYLDKEKTATFGGFVIRGTAKEGAEYHPQFMWHLLKTCPARKEIVRLSGGSTRYNIGQESLESVPVYLPDGNDEQVEIASFLGSVDQKIHLLEQKRELLEQYKKGVMQKIFSREIRFKDDDGNNFPDWEEKQLDDVADVVGGGTPDTAVGGHWNGDIDWFTPTEIKSKYLKNSLRQISQSGLQNSSARLLPAGALLLSSRASVGEIGIATTQCCTNQGFQSLVVKKPNSNEFLYYWILANKNDLIRRSQGSTFLEIGRKEVGKTKLHIPKSDEQVEIAMFLAAIDGKIDLVSQQITHMRDFKKGLLQQMFV